MSSRGLDADPDREVAVAMRLRGDPPPTVRLSRRAIALATGAVATVLAGVTTFALGPVHRSKPAGASSVDLASPPPPAALRALPRDYVLPPGAPRLGPPRSLLVGAHEASGPLDARTAPAPPSGAASEDRTAAERRQALASGLFIAARAATRPVSVASPSGAPVAPTAAAPGEQAGALRLEAGTMIPAALVSEVRSEVAGPAIAQVTENVYDSKTRRTLLIPQGSRLLGSYERGGDGLRLQLTWNRLILPDGRAVPLPSEPSVDQRGAAGIAGASPSRWRRVLAASAATFGLSAGAQLGHPGGEGLILQALRNGGSDTASQVGAQVVGRALDAPRVVVAPAGSTLQVLLLHDLSLEPWPMP